MFYLESRAQNYDYIAKQAKARFFYFYRGRQLEFYKKPYARKKKKKCVPSQGEFLTKLFRKLSEVLSTEKLRKASLKDQYDEISRRYDSIKDENRYLRSTLEFSKNEAIDLVNSISFLMGINYSFSA